MLQSPGIFVLDSGFCDWHPLRHRCPWGFLTMDEALHAPCVSVLQQKTYKAKGHAVISNVGSTSLSRVGYRFSHVRTIRYFLVFWHSWVSIALEGHTALRGSAWMMWSMHPFRCRHDQRRRCCLQALPYKLLTHTTPGRKSYAFSTDKLALFLSRYSPSDRNSSGIYMCVLHPLRHQKKMEGDRKRERKEIPLIFSDAYP